MFPKPIGKNHMQRASIKVENYRKTFKTCYYITYKIRNKFPAAPNT